MDLTLTPSRIARSVRARSRSLYWRRVRLRRRLQRHLHGSEVSIISSNCIGGRISTLAGNPYRSPTVGLSIDPESFLELVSDLPRYLTHELSEDAEATAREGFPVGRMGEVTLHFQHYRAFADAEQHWRERALRVDVDNVVLLCTDRNGMSPDRIARFAALPTPRKVILTAKPYPSFDCAAPVPAFAGASQVGELYTHWDLLEPVLRGPRLDLFR